MAWVMELKIYGKWTPISMQNKPPYEYDTAKEALNMLRICYPDQVRNDRLSGLDGEKFTRVRNTVSEIVLYGNEGG